MPTPAQHAEVESLMARSPVPSLDIQGRRPGNFGADSAIPGLDIDPPHENGKTPLPGDETESRSEGIGGWISRMVNRGKGDGSGKDGESGTYRRIDQDDD